MLLVNVVIHTKGLGQLGANDLNGDFQRGSIVERLEASNSVREKGLQI